jgi:hypothetical protein
MLSQEAPADATVVLRFAPVVVGSTPVAINVGLRVPLLCPGAGMKGIDYVMVRNFVSMSRVLELLGFTPVRWSGKQLRGPCPVHRSRSPQSRSFSVNLATGAFRCFTCGASGNQLDLWRQVHGLTLFDAALDLCHRAQVPVPWFQPPIDQHASRVESEKRNPSSLGNS